MRISFIGKAVFFAGWVYAISEFGIFLGVGLGWVPAFVIALIVERFLILLFAVALVLTSSSRDKRSVMADSGWAKILSKVKRFGTSIWENRQKVTRKVVITALAVGTIALTVGLGSRLVGNELSGRCERVFVTRTSLFIARENYLARGIDPDELYNASYAQATSAYGSDVARQRFRYGDLRGEAMRAERDLEWPNLCLFDVQNT